MFLLRLFVYMRCIQVFMLYARRRAYNIECMGDMISFRCCTIGKTTAQPPSPSFFSFVHHTHTHISFATRNTTFFFFQFFSYGEKGGRRRKKRKSKMRVVHKMQEASSCHMRRFPRRASLDFYFFLTSSFLSLFFFSFCIFLSVRRL